MGGGGPILVGKKTSETENSHFALKKKKTKKTKIYFWTFGKTKRGTAHCWLFSSFLSQLQDASNLHWRADSAQNSILA